MACLEDPVSPEKIYTATEITDLEMKVDTIKFTIPAEVKHFPYRIHSKNYDRPEIFCGYQRKGNRINIFDLGERKIKKSINLDTHGPNSFSFLDLTSVLYKNNDSIFIMDRNSIALIDGEGEVRKRILIREHGFERVFPGLKWYSTMNNGQACFYHEDKLYFATRPFDRNVRDSTLMGYYDFKRDRFSKLPIYFPEEYKEANYGWHNAIQFTYFDEKLIVNFPIMPDVFIYDLEGNLLRRVSIESNKLGRCRPLEVERPSPEEGLEFIRSNPNYAGIMPINNGNYFVMPGIKPIPENPSPDDNIRFCVIFDRDFEHYYYWKEGGTPFGQGGPYFYQHDSDLTGNYEQYLERWWVGD